MALPRIGPARSHHARIRGLGSSPPSLRSAGPAAPASKGPRRCPTLPVDHGSGSVSGCCGRCHGRSEANAGCRTPPTGHVRAAPGRHRAMTWRSTRSSTSSSARRAGLGRRVDDVPRRMHQRSVVSSTSRTCSGGVRATANAGRKAMPRPCRTSAVPARPVPPGARRPAGHRSGVSGGVACGADRRAELVFAVAHAPVWPGGGARPAPGEDEEIGPYRLHLLAGAGVPRGVGVTSGRLWALAIAGVADKRESCWCRLRALRS